MPENRRYGLVITNQSSDADGVDTVALIVNANRRRCNAALFFLLVTGISSGAAVCHHRLHTSTLANMTFDSSMLVVCEDEETAQWVMSAVHGMCPPHSCQPLIEFFGFLRT
ncbi:uncharacterized protein LOC26534764 isoform X1 [Drosophila yakuba]|uniref:Uncharacterized protein, isoform A n=1 Tax=Drosophila yakuba TaxID=7245 RepID=A0A0R1EET5_DROYA|nr:uncharacterized protein LOC120322161 [Drosophila yakuba]XP_039233147.1 uncharacterized protein LOC26534764 isoform X1 [Drosophila yakuba]KRK05700.1 uncharacterized protein Dyak_GE28048, isoform B [Drosophila yakuba]KRK05723.1 uncharacterized protein Dyak_GE27422, isoform A [Drosophila yakuba]